jgi:hypothetical protein
MSGGAVPVVDAVGGAAASNAGSTEAAEEALVQSMGNEFSGLMKADSKADKVSNAQAANSTSATGGVYDKMLSPLNEFRSNFDSIIANVGDIVSRGDISMGDLIQIQFQFTQLAYMNDLSAKVSDKLSTGFQTVIQAGGK